MSGQADLLKERTKRFALDGCELIRVLPASEPGPTVKRQLAKSATSVAANYRAACRARSHAEFTSRIAVVAEEADETLYWLELAGSARLVSTEAVKKLQQEAGELVAIFSASLGTARRNVHRRAK